MAESRPSLESITDFFERTAARGTLTRVSAGRRWSQTIRFDAGLRLLDPAAGEISMSDLGCGLAHVYDYIRGKRLPMTAYTATT